MSYEKISLKSFVSEVKRASQGKQHRRFCFVLGAGASKESGIKSGEELVDIWDREIQERNADTYATWQTEKGITQANMHSFYSEYYEERFRRHPKDGVNFLEHLMDAVNPSCGYVLLSHILTTTRNNLVITTNFDHLIEDAVTYYAQQMSRVLAHEALSVYLTTNITRPTILKIHRDLLLDPANTTGATDALHSNWKIALDALLKEYHPIFIGYAGNDKSLMDYLDENAKKFKSGEFLSPYWLLFGDALPFGRVLDFLEAADGAVIHHNGFDETLVLLGSALGYKEKSKEDFLKKAENRYQELTASLEKFRQKQIDSKIEAASDTSEALRQISTRSGKESAAQILSDIWSKPYETQVSLLQRAITEYPDNAWVLGTAAIVEHQKGNIEQAERYYDLAIGVDPNDVRNLGNYAVFLEKYRKDFDAAETYYKRAIDADPNDADFLGNYATFLHKHRKDYDAAETYYKRAIDADPNHATNLGNYANFLKNCRKNYDAAETYYKRAMDADPNHANNLGNYATFLHEHRKNHDAAETFYKRAIDADPNDADFLGNYAVFLKNCREDYDAAEAYYKRAIDADPNDADFLGNYAIFLKDIRKDYDAADTYYKRAMEANKQR